MRFVILGLVLLLVAPAVVLRPASSAVPLPGATIYRDGFGVPHVYAPDLATLAYANGYVQAQDRLFAMDALRLVGRGEAARVLGPGLLESDFAARRDLGSEQDREAELARASPELQLAFSAFADGVNRALLEMTASGSLPAEFLALDRAPPPWTALDTVAVADFLLARFGTGGGSELDDAQLLAHLQSTLGPGDGEAAFNDVVWVAHLSYPTIPLAEGAFTGPQLPAKRLADLAPAQAQALAGAQESQPFGVPARLPQGLATLLPGFDPMRIRWGSNALLIAPSLARDGRAMVGGGPQTGYFNPQILYEVGLHGGGVDVAGVGVIGAPGVVLGRTAGHAWTVTSGISDQTDIVALPAAGERSYLWDGRTVPLACREELHIATTAPATGVAAPSSFLQEVCTSQVGPIVAWTQDAQGKPAWFFASHAVDRGLSMVGADKWLGLDKAKGLADFRAAFEGFPYTFNFNYAGREGACYHHVGMQPVRDPLLDPRFPTPAGAAWDWSGVLTGAQLPRLCDPVQGYFANWNNLPQAGWTSGDSRELWGSVHRVERLDSAARAGILASPDRKLDLAQVEGILKEAATRDSLAARLVPLLVLQAPPAAQAALLQWAAADYPWRDADRDGLYDDMGHAYYDPVRSALQKLVLGDELGPFTRVWNPDPSTSDDPHAADHGRHDNKDALLVDALSGTTRHPWCDDVTTPQAEPCATMVQRAFAIAGDPGPQRVHQTTFTPIGAGPAYKLNMTNRATYYHFHVGVDHAQSVSAIAPGESGLLTFLDLFDVVANDGQGPVHMRDQLPLYDSFQFKPVPFTQAQAQALSGPPQVLVPLRLP